MTAEAASNSVDVSIVIPAYNEEQRIGATLRSIIAYLTQQPYRWELIVVNDGSTDRTSEIVAGFPQVRCIELPQNVGKGKAVQIGMLQARGKIRVFSDADLSTPITELPKLLRGIDQGCDVCIGSRALNPALVRVHQPWYREYMGKFFNLLVQLLLLPGIKDTQCGFKAFKEEVVRTVFPKISIAGFSFDVEVLYLARKFGYRICEIPVEWYNDPRTKVRLLTDGLKMLVELVQIRVRHWKTEAREKNGAV